MSQYEFYRLGYRNEGEQPTVLELCWYLCGNTYRREWKCVREIYNVKLKTADQTKSTYMSLLYKKKISHGLRNVGKLGCDMILRVSDKTANEEFESIAVKLKKKILDTKNALLKLVELETDSENEFLENARWCKHKFQKLKKIIMFTNAVLKQEN